MYAGYGLAIYWTPDQKEFSELSPVRPGSAPVRNARRAAPRTVALDDVSRGDIEDLAVICGREVAFYGRTGRIVNLSGRAKHRREFRLRIENQTKISD